MRKIMALGLAALLLSACGEDNDLLGKWELDRESTTERMKGNIMAAFLVPVLKRLDESGLEFTKDSLIGPDGAEAVIYDRMDDGRMRVTRVDQNGQPLGRSLVLDPSDDRIDMPIPMVGRVTFVRG
ncbi:hypothetical protein CKO28_06070 [Rhodovibrio sodomensis]|uniref:Lipocalin-like domain-containing protein n=1 Tax=Rhodovibrio sodomensis TaxID=1088 RepID=A0ABS1DCX3_9PROT|nr:hypothetical protein [Rhodovibrio sodomensis]MBK1667598.1 hypothetical protein [Rhodovibrio sodomensis]